MTLLFKNDIERYQSYLTVTFKSIYIYELDIVLVKEKQHIQKSIHLWEMMMSDRQFSLDFLFGGLGLTSRKAVKNNCGLVNFECLFAKLCVIHFADRYCFWFSAEDGWLAKNGTFTILFGKANGGGRCLRGKAHVLRKTSLLMC